MLNSCPFSTKGCFLKIKPPGCNSLGVCVWGWGGRVAGVGHWESMIAQHLPLAPSFATFLAESTKPADSSFPGGSQVLLKPASTPSHTTFSAAAFPGQHSVPPSLPGYSQGTGACMSTCVLHTHTGVLCTHRHRYGHGTHVWQC